MVVVPQSVVNGASNTYRFEIVPNLQIGYGDVLSITFPPEVLLPSSYYVQCKGDDQVGVNSCVKVNSNQLRITLTDIADNFDSSDVFYIFVYNCVNPVSFKPSSVFTGIKLVSR